MNPVEDVAERQNRLPQSNGRCRDEDDDVDFDDEDDDDQQAARGRW